MRSTISAFVIVMMQSAPSRPELEPEPPGEALEHRGVQRVHLVVRERPLEGAVHDGVGQALLPRRDRRAAVAVEPAAREQARADAFQVEEVDPRPAPLDPARWPAPGEQERDRPGLAAGAVHVEAVALAELEGTDEGGALRAIQGERAHQAGER